MSGRAPAAAPASGGLRRRRPNVLDDVTGQIGAAVVGGGFPVGDMLPTETELCDRFAVSRTVVREAVKLLASKGLLKTGAGKGTWVPPVSDWNFFDPLVFSWLHESGASARAIEDLFAFRRVVEPAAAAAAAATASPDQVAGIGGALARMEAATDSLADWVAADIAFHLGIYAASNNLFMVSAAQVFERCFALSFGLSSSNQHHQHCLQEHRDVFSAIARRDAEGARRAVDVLLQDAREDVRQVLLRNREPAPP